VTQHLISDHHFGHENIIENADRPFQDLTDMHQSYVSIWNDFVDPEDTVIHVGDFCWDGVQQLRSFNEKVNGSLLLVKGNHDYVSPDESPIPIVESTIIRSGKYRFWVTHDPADVPSEWTEWVIHGHTHGDTPFMDRQKSRMNVSVDVTEGIPIPVHALESLFDNCPRGESYDTIRESTAFHHQWYQNNGMGMPHNS
jgi:calcineurin-like phosphoesterase family protein